MAIFYVKSVFDIFRWYVLQVKFVTTSLLFEYSEQDRYEGENVCFQYHGNYGYRNSISFYERRFCFNGGVITYVIKYGMK